MEDSESGETNKTIELPISMPSFIVKLWNMVCNPDWDDIISWNESGNAFVIKDQIIFYTTLLPSYYKHNNMTSFVRQLNLYGFHKIPNSQNHVIEFYHPYFQNDEPELLPHIKRKTPVSRHKNNMLTTPEDMHKVLCEVKQIKEKQDNVDDQLEQLQQENSTLWYELNDLRIKHEKQTKIVNKLVQFLINFVQPNIKNIRSARRASASSGRGPTIFEVDGEEGASNCWKQRDHMIENADSESKHFQSNMIENPPKQATHSAGITDENLSVVNYKSPDKILNEIYGMVKASSHLNKLDESEEESGPKRIKRSTGMEDLEDSDRLLELLERKISENMEDEYNMSYSNSQLGTNCYPAIDYRKSASKSSKLQNVNSKNLVPTKNTVSNSNEVILTTKTGNNVASTSRKRATTNANETVSNQYLIHKNPINITVSKKPIIIKKLDNGNQVVIQKKPSIQAGSTVSSRASTTNKQPGTSLNSEVINQLSTTVEGKRLIASQDSIKKCPPLAPLKYVPRRSENTSTSSETVQSPGVKLSNEYIGNDMTLRNSNEATLDDIDTLLGATLKKPLVEEMENADERSQQPVITGEVLGQHVDNMESDLNNLKDFLNTYNIDPNFLVNMFATDLNEGETLRDGESQVNNDFREGSSPDIVAPSSTTTSAGTSEAGSYSLDSENVNLPFDDYGGLNII